MYNLLIADDEKYIRLFIRNCVDWAKLGFQVAGEAGNGRDALDFIAEHQVDAVISDMDMPLMDGADFLEILFSKYPHIVVVALSGYQDYKYIRSAVNYNAKDYLLKPISPDDLSEIFARVRDEIEQRKNNLTSLRERDELQQELTDLKRERLLLDLIQSPSVTSNLDKIEKQMEKLHLGKTGHQYSVFSFIIENNMQNHNMETEFGMPMCWFLIQNVSGEILKGMGIYSHFVSINNYFLAVVHSTKDKMESLEEKCQSVIDKISEVLKIHLCIAIGHVVDSPLDINTSYKNALLSMELKMISSEQVFTYAPKAWNSSEQAGSAIHYQFKNALSAWNTEQAVSILEKIKNDLISDMCCDIQQLKQVYFSIISWLLEFSYSCGLSPSICDLDEQSLLSSFHKYASIDDLFDKLENSTMRIFDTLHHSQNNKPGIVQEILQYITKHICQDIRLSDIAEYIHVTPNYLCTLFKKETGVTIAGYILDLRIEQAKILLRDPSLKVRQIAERLGYSSTKYFCQVFKKHTGTSPAAFREQYPRSLNEQSGDI